ncbi:hypothetical protein KKE60_06630 [Patescibacteria group bacterium]|nr:hypothetical protein [Patescibacteria group bacterium]
MSETKLTCCAKCKNFIWRKEGTWWSKLCMAYPLAMELNPVSGKYETPRQKYEFCRDVNNGHCQSFEQKKFFLNIIRF